MSRLTSRSACPECGQKKLYPRYTGGPTSANMTVGNYNCQSCGGVFPVRK